MIRRDDIEELWRYRELFGFLAWRDIKVRYKQAALGAAWAVLQPLFGMIVFTLAFGRVAGIANKDVPYPIWTYCALVPWTYFSGTLNLAGNSLVSNSNLLTKVYFPRVLLPASSALGGLVDLAIGTAFLVVLMVYYHVTPTWNLLLYPVFVVGLWLLTVGISMWLAALNVKYRDVKHAIPFLVQLWLFVTPIVYPASLVPERYRALLAFNPLSGYVEGIRSSVFSSHPVDVRMLVTSVVGTIALVVIGGIYFTQTERTFADIV